MRIRITVTHILSSVAALVLLIGGGTGISSRAADPAPAASSAPDASSKDPKDKEKYRKSRLTYDESEALADRRELLLTTGEDKAVDLDFDVNVTANGISIGNPSMVATTLVSIGGKKQLVFKPLKSGETTVTARDSEGNIRLIFLVRVAGSNLLRIAGEIRDLLRDVEGIDIRIVGPKIVLEGEVLVPSDYGRITTVLNDKAYGDFVINMSTLSPLGMAVLAKKIESDIRIQSPNVKTRVVNGTIFLEGTVKSVNEATRAVNIAKSYLPEVRPSALLERDEHGIVQKPQVARPTIQSFLSLDQPEPKKQDKLVRITIHFVELQKDYEKFFGFKWQPGFTSDPQVSFGQSQNGAPTGSGGSFSATLSSLFPKLKSAQQAGFARILKTGTVIVRSTQPAQLNEQTKYPYTVSQPNGTVTTQTADVGLGMGVTPLIVGQSEDIQLDLKIKQVDLVSAGSNNGPPITASHEVDTKLYVKSKESAAIAGVNSASIGTSFNKDDPNPGSFNANPNGPQTDALFTLLHTKNYNKTKSQFVIFVTPEIIENASDGSEDLKRNFRVKVK